MSVQIVIILGDYITYLNGPAIISLYVLRLSSNSSVKPCLFQLIYSALVSLPSRVLLCLRRDLYAFNLLLSSPSHVERRYGSLFILGKQCMCPQWDEVHLFRAADVRMRAQGPPPAAPEARQARVQVIAEELRVNHDCQHAGGFRYHHGGGQCETCQHRLPSYLFRCGGCLKRICNRCRHNRL